MRIILTLLLVFALQAVNAQELLCNVEVEAQRALKTDQKVFKTLEQAISNFMNNRKWTDDRFEDDEKIECTLFININEQVSDNTYSATLSVISKRPIYNSSYQSTVINRVDRDFTFTYEEFQAMDFNQNIFINNLTSVLAYYAYIIIGLDYDTYSELGGTKYLQKAEEIVQVIPTNSPFAGWKSIDKNKYNRYFLTNNLLNSRFEDYRKGLYQYHRLGMDVLYGDSEKAMIALVKAMQLFSNVGKDVPNSPIMQNIADAKEQEWSSLFSGANEDYKKVVLGLLKSIDPNGYDKYLEALR